MDDAKVKFRAKTKAVKKDYPDFTLRFMFSNGVVGTKRIESHRFATTKAATAFVLPRIRELKAIHGDWVYWWIDPSKRRHLSPPKFASKLGRLKKF